MTPPRWLFWHRRDLRLADNLSLAAAAAATPAVTGVFVLEPAVLGGPAMAPARRWFLLESLVELEQAWRRAGSRLLLLRGDPEALLPRLARAIGAEVVTWNRDVEPLTRARDRRLAAALKDLGIGVKADWDQLLVAPEALRTGGGDPYRVYGPYLRSWRRQVEAKQARGGLLQGGLDPAPPPTGLLHLPAADAGRVEGVAEAMGAVASLERQTLWRGLPFLPAGEDAEALAAALGLEPGFAGAALCPCRPGEAAALQQLEGFCRASQGAGRGLGPRLLAYESGRNLPAEPGTSALSAALALGTLSPRQAWAAAQAAREEARGEEDLASITVWEQELAWREFYQQALFHFPELADGPYRPQWKRFPWENDPERLSAWRAGQTGVPIVDAALRQLQASGWMHNRCRMIVASYLVKDLVVDWREGERAFLEHLVDGDLAANNGGWQWSASSGMDPRPLRIFNPATQAAKFDPEARYIRTWLPELASVSTPDLISGEIAPLERRGYPPPLVDHRRQQAHFKALYASLPKG